MSTTETSPIFLSRLLLNPRSRQVRSELAKPYEMHRTIMRAFPPASAENARAREEYGVLFRPDTNEVSGQTTLYVQSTVEPDWTFLLRGTDYLIPRPESLACKDISEQYSTLHENGFLAFRLRANPTKCVGKDAENNGLLKGKRVGLMREEEQIQWLIRKGTERECGKPGGFAILSQEVSNGEGAIQLVPRVDARPEGFQRGSKHTAQRTHKTAHHAVLFDGVLRITDCAAFLETLRRGIGPGKAFGFGLLSLARA